MFPQKHIAIYSTVNTQEITDIKGTDPPSAFTESNQNLTC